MTLVGHEREKVSSLCGFGQVHLLSGRTLPSVPRHCTYLVVLPETHDDQDQISQYGSVSSCVDAGGFVIPLDREDDNNDEERKLIWSRKKSETKRANQMTPRKRNILAEEWGIRKIKISIVAGEILLSLRHCDIYCFCKCLSIRWLHIYDYPLAARSRICF